MTILRNLENCKKNLIKLAANKYSGEQLEVIIKRITNARTMTKARKIYRGEN